MLKDKFKVITLCGSTRFKEEYLEAQRDLTLKGYVVLFCPVFHHADGIEITDEMSNMLTELHNKRIDMSSEICVINKDGYIGDATWANIDYAKKTGKRITYMFCNELSLEIQDLMLTSYMQGYKAGEDKNNTVFIDGVKADIAIMVEEMLEGHNLG